MYFKCTLELFSGRSAEAAVKNWANWERMASMMKIVLAQQMRALDKAAEEEIGIPGLLLMENAGRAVADAAESLLEDCAGKRILIFAGKGNNGGDGLGAARWLMNRGADVKVILACTLDALSGSPADELQFFTAGDGVVLEVVGTEDVVAVQDLVPQADLLIDALLGTGFTGELRGLYKDLCQVLNGAECPVLAVDIPTGLNADTGECDHDAVWAKATVTMALPKQGLFLYPGAKRVGELTVADIGMPEKMLADAGGKRFLLTEEIVQRLLPLREPDMHKGDAGRVSVIAGSYGYTGAAALSSFACVKAGAGLVTLLTPTCVREVLSVKLTEVMVKGLSESSPGQLSNLATAEILEAAARANVVALGPGLGVSEPTMTVVRDVLGELTTPCVIDADALTALTGHTELLTEMKAPKILTPHPGELGRLLELSPAEVNRDRVELARECAVKWQAVLVLKGVPTVVALPDGCVYLNLTGNASMATGGSGDVLTGIIAGLLAQQVAPQDAALAGVYLHGLAGDVAAAEQTGLAAGELITALPRARYLVEQGLES